MEIIKQYIGLPKRIYVLFSARTIAAMGSFVYSFLTLFMSNKLGYSDMTISQYLLVLSILTAPAALMGGKLADTFSRKWTYVSLMVCGEICFLVSGFLIDKDFVIKLIFVGVFFVNAAGPVISAMMMDYTTPENRQVSMSLVYLGFNLGFAFGPSVAGFLFVNYLPWIFWGNAIINLIAVVVIVIFIKDESTAERLAGKALEAGAEAVAADRAETGAEAVAADRAETWAEAVAADRAETEAEAVAADRAEAGAEAGKEAAVRSVPTDTKNGTVRTVPTDTKNGTVRTVPTDTKRSLLRQLIRDPAILVVAALEMTFTFSYAQVGYMLPLDMEEYFGIEMGSRTYGFIFSLNGFFVFLLTPTLVYILKKHTPIFNLGIAGVLFGLGFAGYAFTHNVWIMYALVMVWTAGEVSSATNTGVFIAAHAPEEFRARYQSIYDIIQGSGRAVGPMLMGAFLLDHTVSQAWILCGMLCLTSAAAYFVLYKLGQW